MDKNKEYIMHAEEDMSAMEQLLTEALLRTNSPCPNIDGEWERMKSRHQRKTLVRRMVVWTAVAAAFLAAIFILMPKTNDDTIYTAKAEPREIKIIDNQESVQASAKEESMPRKAVAAKTKTVVVPEGKEYKLTLPDGTQVWLNANSSITYPTDFTGNERIVELTGEAYFDVTHDTAHPFIVKTGDISTKVLGTEFNVKAYSPDDTHITLVDGSVSVSCDKYNEVISPGEDATIEGNRLVVNEVNVDDMTCWRDGIVLFDESSLHDILVQIGAWYDMSVVCRNEEALSMKLHYMYDRRSDVSDALKMLQDLSKVNIKAENNTIFVD